MSEPAVAVTPFRYDRLSSGGNVIRRFRLLPALYPVDDPEGNPLLCIELEEFTFNSATALTELLAFSRSGNSWERDAGKQMSEVDSYTAVSYAWGAEHPQYPILINGYAFQVRINLAGFLFAKSTEEDYSTWYWVDQICINQDDLDERSLQVSMMKDIFFGAQEVCLWLGKDDQHGYTALNLIWNYKLYLEKVREVYMFKHMRDGWEYAAAISLMRQNPEATTALEQLMERPYWNRLWVSQEIIFSSRWYMLCGRMRIPPADLDFYEKSTMPYILGTNTSYLLKTLSWMKHGDYNRTAKLFYKTAAKGMDVNLDLAAALRRFGRGQCTDPRDHVFAIQGCVASEQRVTIDYSLTAEEVFWAAIRKICEQRSASKFRLLPGLSEMVYKLEGEYYPPFWQLRNDMGLDDVIKDVEILIRFENWMLEFHSLGAEEVMQEQVEQEAEATVSTAAEEMFAWVKELLEQTDGPMT